MPEFEIGFKDNSISVPVNFSESVAGNKASFGEVQTINVAGDPYEGDYVVTPKVDQQVMPTKGKVMAQDVTIKSIPVFKTRNASGGNTVYIAKEM